MEEAILKVIEKGELVPRVILAVDLFGQPADYEKIGEVAEKCNLLVLEDGAQGFGGAIGNKRACSFGDISTTSFFPAKPLGCYGDGGAIFTDNDEWAKLIRSYCIHGKGTDKYDNVRISLNSRLDTLQAAILQVKFKAFVDYELDAVNKVASNYSRFLGDVVKVPVVKDSFYSSWAQYSILLESKEARDNLQDALRDKGIPTMVYYPKPMHSQLAFKDVATVDVSYRVTERLCDRILALPMHPYIDDSEMNYVCESINSVLGNM